MICLQTVEHGSGLVVLTDDELAAAAVAHALDLALLVDDVVACAALFADAAAAHAVDDDIVSDRQLQHLVDADAHLLDGLCLCDGAGHTVQNEAVCTVSLGQAVLQDANDDLIGDQCAGVHEALCLQAHLGAVLDSSAEDVAGADGGDVQLCADDLSLRAFACAGGAQQNQIHRNSPLLI